MNEANNLETKIRDALDRNGRPDPRRGSNLARQAVAQFENRLRAAERHAWIAQLLLTAILVFSAVRWIGFGSSVEPAEAATYTVLTFVSIGGLIVMKLWYWVVNGKLAVLKELALLRLELSEQRPAAPARAESSPTGAPGVFPESPGDAAPGADETPAPADESSYRHRRPISWAALTHKERRGRHGWFALVILAGALAGALAFSLESLGLRTPLFVVQEEVTYRIAPGEIVQARSDIQLTAWPKGADSIKLTLPYTEAVLKDVSIGGESLAVESLERGRFRVDLPRKGRHYESRTLQVDWEFPLATLDYNPMGYYVARLRPLVAATAYSLRVVLDPDSGFVYAPNPNLHEWSAFKGSIGRLHLSYGTCGIAIRRPAGSESAPVPPHP